MSQKDYEEFLADEASKAAEALRAAQRETVAVTLVIDNIYADDRVETTVETQIEAPPFPLMGNFDTEDDDYANWEYEAIFEHTGTGRCDDAAYFVTVASSDRPDLIPVGTEFEFC